MEKNEIILLTGITIGLIWMGVCILIEEKLKKYIIMIGIIIDLVLFIICRNYKMLFFGLLGGLVCGFVPGVGGSVRKYETAIREMKGIRNWVVVSMIFFVMMCMTISIAYPKLFQKIV